VPLHPADERKQ
jgi:hypothetical protein